MVCVHKMGTSTSSNDMQLHRKHVHFVQATSAIKKLHQLGDISHRPPVSVMTFARQYGILTLECLHHPRLVVITQSLSSVDYPERHQPAHNGQSTLGIANPHHFVFTHNSVDVGHGLHKQLFACTQWSNNVKLWVATIVHNLYKRSIDVKCFLKVSSIPCKHQYADALGALPTLFVSYAHRSAYVRCGLQVLFVSCTHDSVDVIQREVASPKAYMQIMWHVRILQGTSGSRIRLKPRLVSTKIECVYFLSDIIQFRVASAQTCMHGRGMCTSRKLGGTMTCNINQGLDASTLLCAYRLHYFSCGLSASSKKHHLWPACIDNVTSSKKVSNNQGTQI